MHLHICMPNFFKSKAMKSRKSCQFIISLTVISSPCFVRFFGLRKSAQTKRVKIKSLIHITMLAMDSSISYQQRNPCTSLSKHEGFINQNKRKSALAKYFGKVCESVQINNASMKFTRTKDQVKSKLDMFHQPLGEKFNSFRLVPSPSFRYFICVLTS